MPEEVSEELRDFLASCFAKDAGQRKKAAELLMHPWVAVWSGERLEQSSAVAETHARNNEVR